MNSETINFRYCNFSNKEHCSRLGELINDYIADPMGGGTPLGTDKLKQLIHGLENHTACFVLFIEVDHFIAGMATCFINFSTFKAQPYINIHDLIVDHSFRGQGYGRLLLQQITEIAYERQCCKITLEVRDDNMNAQNLYINEGFRDTDPPMMFWTKTLD